MKDALKDNMIIPLFYEGRIIQQYLEDESLLDKYFDMITNGLDKEEKVALKTRFSRSKMLSQTKEAIYAKAFDISTHYLKTFKGTGLNLMSIASNSNKLSEVSSKELKNELKRFNKLKEIVEKRYKEKPDKKIYTTQITKLLDEHVIVGNITKTEAVNIFDDEMFEKFIKRTEIAVMDMVNQIQDTIKDYINPAFYQKFSTLINNTIIQHHNKRLSDSDLLNRVKKIRAELKKDVPSELSNNKTKLVFYRKLLNFLQDKTNQNQCKNAIQIARDTYDIIKQKTIVHWTKNTKILNEMRNSLDDYFFDVVEKKIGIIFKPEDLNEVVESLIDFAKEHEAK
ncbi:hypothetical protein N7281_02630 [Rickettsia hoogstraalii]|nr:hypothetical protein [Rickettsia hoogstraalii]